MHTVSYLKSYDSVYLSMLREVRSKHRSDSFERAVIFFQRQRAISENAGLERGTSGKRGENRKRETSWSSGSSEILERRGAARHVSYA